MKTLEVAEYELDRDVRNDDLDLIKSKGTFAHFHHQIEMGYVESGCVYVNVNGVEKTLSKGSFVISDSYDIHSYRIDDPKTTAFYVLITSKNHLRDYCSATKYLTLNENFILDGEAARDICGLFKLLVSNYGKNNELFNNGIVASIMGIVSKNLRYKAADNSEKSHIIMRDVLSYIHKHFNEDITLGSLARRFGYTPNHFSYMFNGFISAGLKEYLNAVRAENAASLLKEGFSPLDAAMNSGFDSASTFYRAFERRYRTTPGKYLKQTAPELPQ
jgi:AraC-like DNA-binding protein